MSYLEKVLNDRIEELKKENERFLSDLRNKLNNNSLDCSFDIYDCYMFLDANEVKINELEKLKKGLGLTPIEEIEGGVDNDE